jgi:hypothetical protein
MAIGFFMTSLLKARESRTDGQGALAVGVLPVGVLPIHLEPRCGQGRPGWKSMVRTV